MSYAPIALFAYNRLTHTRLTIEALQKNTLADQSDLIIFSDAPKSEAQAKTVNSVRNYIHHIEGFKSVTIIERKTNYGLACSIIDGVTSVLNERGRIIVLEDDLVTSPYFLDFMNAALDTYQTEEKVMHISGYIFPIDNNDLPETFFLRTASCWGWATWDRAWKYFEKNPEKMVEEYSNEMIKHFNMDGSYNFWNQVEQNKSGLINTWAIFWYASVFKKNGLCLHPAISMVNNIGHDSSGQHCAKSNLFHVEMANEPIIYFEKILKENLLALERVNTFFLSISASLFSRCIGKIRKTLFRLILGNKDAVC